LGGLEMYLKISHYKSTGRTYLSINKSYLDPKAKKNKNESIMKIGYLDQFEKEMDDPISHFEALAQKMTEEEEVQNCTTFEFNTKTRMQEDEDNITNLGYIVLSKIYHELGIDKYLLSRQRNRKFKYNTNSIMQLLVFSRIIFPGSKLFAYGNKEYFFERFNFELEDVYRSLSFFNEHKEGLQLWIHEHI